MTRTEIKITTAGDGAIGWRLLCNNGQLDWSETLEEVHVHAAEQLVGEDWQRWQEACDAGHGPDVDADVNGVRWVVEGSL